MNPEVRTLSFWNLNTDEEKEEKESCGSKKNADQELPDRSPLKRG
jgi:hypothetical protein